MSVHEIKIPSPGESITEVEIGNWLKKDGDLVQIDESLCEIETDKATLPLVAEVAGKLKIFLEQGATANVGDVACSIDPDKAGSIPVEEIGTTTLGSDQPGDPVEEKKVFFPGDCLRKRTPFSCGSENNESRGNESRSD